MFRTACAMIVTFVMVGSTSQVRADDHGEAKVFIADQIAQIQRGDVKALKAGFTPRLRNSVTKAAVERAKSQLKEATPDELVASVTRTNEGNLKITMKNGRTLTTLIKASKSWLADTLWFK